MTLKYFRSSNSIGKVFIAYYYSTAKGKRVVSAHAGSGPVRLGSSACPIAALGPWVADLASASPSPPPPPENGDDQMTPLPGTDAGKALVMGVMSAR